MSAVPLPNAFARWRDDDEDAGAWGRPDCDVYTADQLRAYGDAVRAEAAETIRQLRSVLRVIAEQDPIESALDPQWAARIAKGGLDAAAIRALKDQS